MEIKKQKVELTQSFKNAEGKEVFLKDILSPDDYWESKNSRNKVTILTHNAVMKIASLAGFRVLDYVIKTQPDCYNNYQYTVQADMVDSKDKKLEPQWGEANRSNLGNKGRNNPANMAQKRSFDRTVLKALGLGLLSEEELSDEKEEEQMNKLSPDLAKAIAPIINKVLLIKNKVQLNEFNAFMAKEKSKYKPEQLEAIRKAFSVKLTEVNKTKF